ncbi:hypothetical protein [Atlantibacter hermannii]|uniref:hypothetical protein n=1 Tax=Atlantibacter hermannii TaxID=565 RepID=UPI000ED162CB|nr:hypothetical protein [Atlantibacter hermannii]HAI51369.1 hypothetical protein [Enterobacteriaceae bacterium]
MAEKIIKGERFQSGEIWQSPRGFLYKVVAISGREAILRMGTHGRGRKTKRQVDAISGWSLYVGEE